MKKRSKGKRKNKGGLTGSGRAFLGEEQAHESELWSSAVQKVTKAFGKVDFALAHLERVEAVIFCKTKAMAKTNKEKERVMPIHRQDFQFLKISLKRNLVLFVNKAIGTPIALTIHQRVRGTIEDIQLGWRQFPWILPIIRRALFWILDAHDQLDQEKQSEDFRNMRSIMALQQNSVLAISLFVSANSETETCRESCIIHFLAKPPCSTIVDVLETGDVPILFSLPQTQNLGTTLELDPKGAKITCPAFGMYASPIEYSTMGHIVLDLTSLAYQTKSRERSARPRKHVTFALSHRKSAFPARVQELDDDEDDRRLVGPVRTTVPEEEDEDDKPLVQSASKEKAPKRESSAIRRVPTLLWKKRTSKMARSVCHTGIRCVRNLA